MFKKLLILIIFITLHIDMFSDDNFWFGGILYCFVDANSVGVVNTTGQITYSGDIIIPAFIEYEGKEYDVTTIYGAFCGKGLKSIYIGKNVSSLINFNFSYLDNLESVRVDPDNKTYDSRENCNAVIETTTNNLIAGTGFTIIPNSVKTICSNSFSGLSNLISIDIPEGVETIQNMAFINNKNLKSIKISKSVNKMGFLLLDNCPSLTSIIIEKENKYYDSRENCNAIIETSKNELISGCSTTKIPESVTSIMMNAFNGCTGLESVIIPDNVEQIGNGVFMGCSNLKSIIIGKSLTKSSQLTAISFSSIFNGCNSIESVEVSKENQKYDSRDNCNGIIETGTNALVFGCKNTIFPSSINKITGAFIGDLGLTDIFLPDNISSIDFSFMNCNSLKNVTIGKGIKFLGESTFSNCPNLENMYISAEAIPEAVTNEGYYNAFNETPISNVTLHVPNELIDNYKSTRPWNQFKEIVGLEDSPTSNEEIKKESGEIEKIYTIEGKKSFSYQKGVNIIRYKNGETKKLLIK